MFIATPILIVCIFVLGLEMNGKYKFCLLWSCGCVMSERAIKEVDSDTCHSCGAKYEKEDLIILNADGDDLTTMEENMKNRREKLKALRKEKKDKKCEKRKSELKVDKNGSTNGFAVPKPPTDPPAKKKTKTDTIHKKNGESSSLDAKKAEINGENSKQSSKKKTDKEKTESKIDITQSKVYKSLFTSSESSKNRGKDKTAHWITYNPYHL